jgi:hypothetical protein
MHLNKLFKMLKGYLIVALAITAIVGYEGKAYGAADEVAGTSGSPTALAANTDNGDTLVNATDSNGTDFAYLNLGATSNTDEQYASLDFDFNTTLQLLDEANTNDNDLQIDGTSNIATGTTATFGLGVASGGTGSSTDNLDSGVDFVGAISGGGTIVVHAADNAIVGTTANNRFKAQGAVTLAAMTLRASDSGANAGGNLTVTDLGTGGDAVDITTFVARAGKGQTNAAVIGGDLLITDMQGALTGTTWSIQSGDGGDGGAGDAGGAGGTLTITDKTSGTTAVTTLNIFSGDGGDGGADDVGGAGGTARIVDWTTAITSTTVNIYGGDGGNGLDNDNSGTGGAGGEHLVNLITGAVGDASTDTLNIYGGAAGTAGVGTSAVGGTAGAGASVDAGFTITGAVTGAVNLTGGAGSSAGATGAGAGGAGAAGGAVVITEITGAIAGDLVMLGGAGGNGVDAATTVSAANGGGGGLVTLTDANTSLTGDLTMTGGAGGNGGNGGTTGVGGDGADGGAVLTTSIDAYAGTAATGGTVLVTGGKGGNGGSGATGSTGNGGAAGAGGAATLTTDTGASDIATLTVTGGVGGNGGSGGATGASGIAGGAGGAAAASITGATSQITTVNVTAGAAGDAGTSNTVTGITGTTGGTATATIDVAITGQGGSGATTINVTGGAGGDGGDTASGVAGVAGVTGAGATLDLGAGNKTANITLSTGAAGTAGVQTLSGAGAGGAAGAGGSATLAVTAAQTITGDITAGGDGEGVITTAGGKLTQTGSIGALGAQIGTFTSGNAGGLDITGNLYVKDIAMDQANSQLNFSGTTLQTVSGFISAGGATSGEDITFGANAIVTFEKAIGKDLAGNTEAMADITTSNGSTIIFDSTINAATLTLDDSGTTTLNGAVTLSGAVAIQNTSEIIIGENFVAGSTVITQSGGTYITTAATVTMPQSFNSGTMVLVEDSGGNGTAAADAAKITFTETTLATYTAAAGADAHEMLVTATKKSSSAIATALGVTEDAAGALDAAADATVGDAAIATIFNDILLAGGAAATEMTEQVQGTPAGLSATSGAATASAGAAVVSVGSSRMAALRSGNSYASTFGSGFSAGNLSLKNSMWMKPFASFGDQGERKSIAGYDSDTYGLAIGADTRLNAKSVMGISFSYADTDVDGKGASRSHSDISSYQLTGYGDYTTRDYYIEALVGYAYNDISTARDITATNTKAQGGTSSDQFMISVTSGRPMKMGGAAYFTPSVGLNITHVVNQAYTETGASALNLRVDAEDITIAKLNLGGRYHTNIKSGNGSFTPELRAKLLYDMAGDDGSSTNTFTGGGATFSVKGLDVVEFATSVGAGLAYTPNFDDSMSLSVNYDAELKENFTGHSANFNLKYAF